MMSQWSVDLSIPAVPERPHITLLLSSIFFFFLILLFVENPEMTMAVAINTCASATLSFCPQVVHNMEVVLSTKKWLWMKDFSGVSGWSLIKAEEPQVKVFAFVIFNLVIFSFLLLFHTFWTYCILCLRQCSWKWKGLVKVKPRTKALKQYFIFIS